MIVWAKSVTNPFPLQSPSIQIIQSENSFRIKKGIGG